MCSPLQAAVESPLPGHDGLGHDGFEHDGLERDGLERDGQHIHLQINCINYDWNIV